MDERPALRRHLGTLTLTLYGVGVIVGAGIYVLVGSVAALVGNGVWLALLGAGIAALPTGLSYAELSSRYPRSAGEAVFAGRAFDRPALSFVVGFLVLASGVVSTAALSHGFARYFSELTGIPHGARLVLVAAFLAVLTVVNHRGIRESTWFNVACTVLSLAALGLLVVAGVGHWGAVDLLEVRAPDGTSGAPLLALLSAAALAFYAYIGFEDICNVAEEVAAPQRSIPRAILASLLISGVVYASVAITAVSTIPAAELADSQVPLAEVAQRLLPSLPKGWLSVVAILAVSNSALFNLIMVSRIFYGMGREGLLPPQFSRVHRARQTPTWGVSAGFLLALGFGLSGFFEVLVESTNVLLLAVFFLVNLSLIVIRVRKIPPDDPETPHFVTPVWVAAIGMLVTGWMILQFSAGAYLRAGVALVVGLALYVARRLGFEGPSRFALSAPCYDDQEARRREFAVLAFHDAKAKNLEELEGKMVDVRKRKWDGRRHSFPILLDHTGETVRTSGVNVFPTTLLIDPDGKVVKDGDRETLRRILMTTGEREKELARMLRSDFDRALRSLRKLSQGRLCVLLEFAQSGASPVQSEALGKVFVRGGGGEAVAFFAGATGLQSSDPAVRLGAVRSRESLVRKRRVEPKSVRFPIGSVLRQEPDPEVREAAQKLRSTAEKMMDGSD